MSRSALEGRVRERLRKHAAYDPLAWLPVIGSTRRDGARHGLAVELFGGSPRQTQLESLQRALFQLAREGQIDVAQFAAGPQDGGPMPRHPRRQDDQTYLTLTLRPDTAGCDVRGAPGPRAGVRPQPPPGETAVRIRASSPNAIHQLVHCPALQWDGSHSNCAPTMPHWLLVLA